MVQSEINKSGGILGIKLELAIEDNQCKLEKGIAAYMGLLMRGNITTFVSGNSSRITYAQCTAVQNFEPFVIWIGAYFLETGVIIMEGKGTELMKDDHIRKAYLGL